MYGSAKNITDFTCDLHRQSRYILKLTSDKVAKAINIFFTIILYCTVSAVAVCPCYKVINNGDPVNMILVKKNNKTTFYFIFRNKREHKPLID